MGQIDDATVRYISFKRTEGRWSFVMAAAGPRANPPCQCHKLNYNLVVLDDMARDGNVLGSLGNRQWEGDIEKAAVMICI